ncbi:MAG: peptide chain release factor 1 [Deltaproteobacteria bacterium]|nr:peptide chain release factor 1 [Deltaproteobacteria bacterium]
MFENIAKVLQRYDQLGSFLIDPEVFNNPKEYTRYIKERNEIEPIALTYRAYRELEKGIESARQLLDTGDEDIRLLAKEELQSLERQRESIEDRLKELILPNDPLDSKDVLLEIRAGAGGEESALFAGDLLRMYLKYAEKKKWHTELLSASTTGIGGYKEVIVLIEGEKVYSRLKFESGVHRVQRVPRTEASGRIHTSTATVAILPEADDVEIEIKPEDLKIDTFRAGGHGGQNVNKLETAIRITHIPTGMVVVCQDERSQYQNKMKAMTIIKSRLLSMNREKQTSERAQDRRSQVGTGDRSEKIRTYNFPQNRVTDHRINYTVHTLGSILSGEIDEFVDALTEHYRTNELARATSGK